MNPFFAVFLPHILGMVGVVAVVGFGWRTPISTLFVTLLLFGLLFLGAIAVTPSHWLRAKALFIPQPVPMPTTAIILGFGYEGEGSTMHPGAANQFLVDWLLTNHPQVTTLLVQEGVRSAITPEIFDAKIVYRIHRHDSAIYVDTLDTAFCALQEVQKLGTETVLLVAHDLQLQRAVWDFERVRQAACINCTVITATIPDTPYPTHSVHWQTRHELIYKLVALLLLRPRDFLRATPTVCKAPL